MGDWLLIASRLALYLDLGLLFGVPLFGLYALKGDERSDVVPFRRLVAVLAGFGIVSSLFGFALLAAAMSGTDLTGIESATLTMLLGETSVGWAFIAREVALVLALAVAILLRRRGPTLFILASVLGAIAVATLAWAGHGAASEGGLGIFHLTSDIAHLLAASAWLGALAMLGLMLLPGRAAQIEHVRIVHRALAGFATVGSIFVGLIVLTGVVNGLFLIGLENLGSLGSSLYGQLMIAKLLLFSAMVALAASNRFRLAPDLERSLDAAEPVVALRALRRSLAFETGCAIAVLALVAWLGTLEPPMSAI
ncbi:MAG: copper homeostasis membrane protein CopD [Pseudomonadota bacterium]